MILLLVFFFIREMKGEDALNNPWAIRCLTPDIFCPWKFGSNLLQAQQKIQKQFTTLSRILVYLLVTIHMRRVWAEMCWPTQSGWGAVCHLADSSTHQGERLYQNLLAVSYLKFLIPTYNVKCVSIILREIWSSSVDAWGIQNLNYCVRNSKAIRRGRQTFCLTV